MDFKEEYLTKLNETEARSKSNTKRLDEMEKRQEEYAELKSQIAVIQKEIQYMTEELKGVKESLKAITDKPAKRWESAVSKVLDVLIGAVIGYLLIRLGVG